MKKQYFHVSLHRPRSFYVEPTHCAVILRERLPRYYKATFPSQSSILQHHLENIITDDAVNTFTASVLFTLQPLLVQAVPTQTEREKAAAKA